MKTMGVVTMTRRTTLVLSVSSHLARQVLVTLG